MIIEAASEVDMPALCNLLNEASAKQESFPITAYGVAELLRTVEDEQMPVARIDAEIDGFASALLIASVSTQGYE